MTEKKNVIVPAYFTREHVSSKFFTKARYIHLSNSQREKEVAAGRIELLDSERRIYRSTQSPDRKRFFIASSANGSGAVSMEIPRSIQNVLASEITMQHASSIQAE